jgi:hypothetical protein
VDGRDLYRHRLAADAIYRGTYQRALTRSLGVAWTQADRWGNRELAAQQRHQAWAEDHQDLGVGYREVSGELGLRSRQRVAFAELQQPTYLTGALGPVSEVEGVPVLTPGRLLALLRSLPAHLDQVGVMLLAQHARQQLHPAT